MELSKSKNSKKYAEEQDSLQSSEIVKQTDIKGTDFKLIELDTEEVQCMFIAWGQYRVTNMLTREEAKKRVDNLEKGKVDWEIVGAMSATINVNLNKQ